MKDKPTIMNVAQHTDVSWPIQLTHRKDTATHIFSWSLSSSEAASSSPSPPSSSSLSLYDVYNKKNS
jgi:hypothetical protein